ncbi:MAG: hypothetical protein LBR89_00325, partial [Holosporales bacterium]|nr:hypothetical protein [Holosporales bacterium]
REIAFPQSFVFSNDDSSNLIPCDSTVLDGFFRDDVLATENQLLTTLRNYLSDIKDCWGLPLDFVHYSRLSELLHRYFVFISGQHTYSHETFCEIIGLIQEMPYCIPLIRYACFRLFDEYPSRISSLISQIKERVHIGIDVDAPHAPHKVKLSNGFEPFLSIHGAPSFDRDEYNKEKFDAWVQRLKEFSWSMKPLIFASDKPVVRKVLDDWNAAKRILEGCGIRSRPGEEFEPGQFIRRLKERMNIDGFDILDRLLSEKLININTRDESGCTLQTQVSEPNMLELLYERGANVHVVDDLGQSLLHYYTGDASILESLIHDYYMDVNTKDYYGRTFLHQDARSYSGTAAATGHEIFFKYHGDIHAKDCFGRTALHYADKPEMIQAFFDRGFNVDEADRYGRTALHYGIWKTGRRQGLLTGKASVNIQDNDKKTPLHVAVCDNMCIPQLRSAVLDLINAGADVKMVDRYGKKAIDYARERGKINEIVELLADAERTADAERNVQGDLAERAE